MSTLFSPLTIREITLKNRIVVSPMCQYSSKDGFANDWHLVHLGSRAVGGAGLVMTEAAAVSPEGRISPFDLGIWHDEHVDFLKRITDFIAAQGSVAGIQLAHAGRKGSTTSPWEGNKVIWPEQEGGWQTLGPSALPFSEKLQEPVAMDGEGIQKVLSDFEAAAHRALRAGFQVAEIHAAHGYLLHEFLSPMSNQRTDRYGGSFENRIRLTLEVVQRVRAVWPETYPLFVRLSVTDWIPGGWTPEESIALAKELKNKGVDLIDCSTGGNVPQAPIPVGPGYQVPFAERIKKGAGILTGAVGMITDAAQAEAILADGQADVVLLARELLRDPHFPLRAARELGMAVAWPVQYERARR